MLHPGYGDISRGPLISPAGLGMCLDQVPSMPQGPSFFVYLDIGFECLEKIPR